MNPAPNQSTGLTAETMDSLFRKTVGRQSTIGSKLRRSSGVVGSYVKRLGRKLKPAEADAERDAQARAAELEKQYSKVGRQRARKMAVAREFKDVSSGAGKLDVPRRARRKIARARAKRGA